MKELFISIGYLLLALVEGLVYLVFWLFIGLPIRLWEKWNYEAQTLRYSGGGWGHSMAQAGKKRPDRPNKPDRPDKP